MVRRLVDAGYIVSPRVRESFLRNDRALFVPDDSVDSAHIDSPMPIGHMQTISAPSMVAIMLEALELQSGQRVLEIGAGSGYHAALCAGVVAPAQLYTVERVPALVHMARNNLDRAGVENVVVVEGDGSVGLPEHGPYDRIYLTAAAPAEPVHLLDQVVPGGFVLGPVGRSNWWQDLVKVTRIPGKEPLIERLGGCVFVPLVGKKGFRA